MIRVAEIAPREIVRHISPIAGFGEDLSFCRKCDELEIPMHCDSRIKVGHIAQTVVTEEKYLQGVIL